MTTAMKRFIEPKVIRFLLLSIVSLFFSIQLQAQKKFSLELNVCALQPTGKDITKTHQLMQPWWWVHYNSRHKFDHPYISILPNLNYSVNSNVLIGLQSGVYAHFDERYSGYRSPLFVTVPLMASGRVTLAKMESGKMGIHLAGGRNFFHMRTFPFDAKNGWIFDASVFYQLKGKGIFKLGVEKQLDNGYYYYKSDNAWMKDETFRYTLNRLAIKLSYGFVIKQF
jgi:hypothetical protein